MVKRCHSCWNFEQYCSCATQALATQLPTRCTECGNRWDYCPCIERPQEIECTCAFCVILAMQNITFKPSVSSAETFRAIHQPLRDEVQRLRGQYELPFWPNMGEWVQSVSFGEATSYEQGWQEQEECGHYDVAPFVGQDLDGDPVVGMVCNVCGKFVDDVPLSEIADPEDDDDFPTF